MSDIKDLTDKMNNCTASGAVSTVVHPADGGVLLFVPPFIRTASGAVFWRQTIKKFRDDRDWPVRQAQGELG